MNKYKILTGLLVIYFLIVGMKQSNSKDTISNYLSKLPKPIVVRIAMKNPPIFIINCGYGDNLIEVPDPINKELLKRYTVMDTIK
jgi:hypothetical protein